MLCRSCGSQRTDSILYLGHHAWCNDFLTKDHIGKELKYPLGLWYCNQCTLAQIDHTVPKERMFSRHSYVSGTTQSLAKHFLSVAKYVDTNFSYSKHDLIVDIGGNDGTNLQQYYNLGYTNLLNVESANNIAEISKNKGIPTHNLFFNENYVNELGYAFHNEKLYAKIICANGVFFHLEELDSAIKGIKKLLHPYGTLVVQFIYLLDMIAKTAYDNIYHEHLCYYSLQSLENLLKSYGLKIFHTEHADIHGGSIVAFITHDENNYFKTTEDYKAMLDGDKQYVTKESLKLFAKRVESSRYQRKKHLEAMKKSGHHIYAFGAPAKGNTYLTYNDINSDLIECIFEINELKIGKYTPVTHIPIVKQENDKIPDNSRILLLAWNFVDEIINKNKDLIKRRIQFILPH